MYEVEYLDRHKASFVASTITKNMFTHIDEIYPTIENLQPSGEQ